MNYCITVVALFLLASLAWPSTTAVGQDLPGTSGDFGSSFSRRVRTLVILLNVINCGKIECDMEVDKERPSVKEQLDGQPPGIDAMKLLADVIAKPDKKKILLGKTEGFSQKSTSKSQHKRPTTIWDRFSTLFHFPQDQQFKPPHAVTEKPLLPAYRSGATDVKAKKQSLNPFLKYDIRRVLDYVKKQRAARTQSNRPRNIDGLGRLLDLYFRVHTEASDISPVKPPPKIDLQILLDEMFAQAKKQDFISGPSPVLGDVSDNSNDFDPGIVKSVKLFLDEIFGTPAKTEEFSTRFVARLSSFLDSDQATSQEFVPAPPLEKIMLQILLDNIFDSQAKSEGHVSERSLLRVGVILDWIFGDRVSLQYALNPETATKEDKTSDNSLASSDILSDVLRFQILLDTFFDSRAKSEGRVSESPLLRVGDILDWIFGDRVSLQYALNPETATKEGSDIVGEILGWIFGQKRVTAPKHLVENPDVF